jgi:lysophospholipase
MKSNDNLISNYEEAELIETESLKAPPGYDCFFYTSKDLTKLRVTVWNTGSIKGTIVLQSGRTEFTEKYFEVVSEFIERGYCIAMMDWRGQGKSSRVSIDPNIGHVDSFKDYDNDLSETLAEVYSTLCPKPWIGMGHSMGGCLIASHATNADSFDRIILCAPMLSMRMSFLTKLAGLLLGLVSKLGFKQRAVQKPDFDEVSGWNFEDFNVNTLTSDPERYRRSHDLINQDPSLGLGGLTVGWLFEALKRTLIIKYSNWIDRIEKPLLLINATHDKLVDTKANASLCNKAKRISQIDLACKHEVLMETDDIRKEAWSAIDLFLDST